MKWQNRDIIPIRHRYNCQINDPVYPPSLGWLGMLVCDLWHGIHKVPVSAFRSSERAIEIPLAIDFLSHYALEGSITELGCVLPYYILKRASHAVYDLTDDHPQCIKRDIRTLGDDELKGVIVSISTLEHLGLPEYGIEEGHADEGVSLLKQVIANAHKYFITVPIGYNKVLDDFILSNSGLGEYYITRIKQNPEEWGVVDKPALTDEMKKFGTYLKANTVCVFMKTGQDA